DAEALLQDVRVVIDLAATGAGEVALEQWLQHQRERITRHAVQAASDDVAGDLQLLANGNRHARISCGALASFGTGGVAPALLIRMVDRRMSTRRSCRTRSIHMGFRAVAGLALN